MPTATTSPLTVMPAIVRSRRPREMVRILIIARVTQPRMMRLIGLARDSARKPRRNAAGRPPWRPSGRRGARAAREGGGPPAVAPLGELGVRQALRLPAEPGEEEGGQHPAHHEVP